MRAVTVPFPRPAASAGFVFPGDRVDMVLTQEVAGGGDGPPLKVSETIVRNLRVLATDQRIDSKDEEGKTVRQAFSTVTLEATPRLPRRSPSRSRSARCRCRCARSPTIRPSWSARSPRRGQGPAGTNPADERSMLLRSPTAAGQQHHLSRPVATSRASSAAPSRPVRAEREASTRQQVANAAGAAAVRRRARWPVVRVARGNNVTVRSGGSSLR
jgi:pilus assembly protein CpaB